MIQSYRRGIPKALIDSLGGVQDPAMIAAKTAWRGNCLPLHMIPPGTLIYNVGLYKGKGGQMCRSAGTYATVLGGGDQQVEKYRMYVNVKLQSGEVRRIHKDACATIGVASNANWNRRQLGKAGRSRWLGIRPTVRGVAMNANEHPHGGGRGKSKGNRHPVSIWGRTPVGLRLLGKLADCGENVADYLLRPREVIKPGRSPTSTSMWLPHDHVLWAAERRPRAPNRPGTVAFTLRYVQFIGLVVNGDSGMCILDKL